jgi:AAA+ ATPase superfamily predicted ATPase
METEFVGRKAELQTLNDLWASGKSSLVILYGRRRVGKTRLLTHWLKSQGVDSGFYWMAEATSPHDQLRSFTQTFAAYEDPELEIHKDLTFPTWEHSFRQIAKLAEKQRVAVLIDEVTYIMEIVPDFVTSLQKAWDQWLKKSKVMLVLSGSDLGLIEQGLLAYKAPLYGRETAKMQLIPLQYSSTKLFFPEYDPTERIKIYAMCGGIPAYWERLNNHDKSVLDNLKQQLRLANNWLVEEARILLRDFIKDTHNFVGILRAISEGYEVFSEIAERAGISTGHTSRYLSILRETGFVKRITPLSDKNPEESRKGRYIVTDPYLRFYYRYLSTSQSKVAMGRIDELVETIENDLPNFVRKTWIDLCQHWVALAASRGEIPVAVDDIGSEWKRGNDYIDDIDILGISEKERTLVLGHCHWGNEPADPALMLQRLINKEMVVMLPKGKWSVYFVGFSSSGWANNLTTNDLLEEARTVTRKWDPVGLRLLDLEEVDADLFRWTIG